MILSKAYDEIMDKIEVTEEMRQRVLKNVQMKIADEPEHKNNRYHWEIYIGLAAAVIILLAVALFVPGVLSSHRESGIEDTEKTTETTTPVEEGVPDIEEFTSLDELSEKVGFKVAGVQKLPFVPEHTEYYSYWGDMAEIHYILGDSVLIYRQEKGSEDVSGDYNVYSVVKDIDLGDGKGTLKGDDDSFKLAIWSDGSYSYSIYYEKGFDTDTFMSMLGR